MTAGSTTIRFRWSQGLPQSEAKALCNRRVNSIENGVCTRALYPGRASVRRETIAGFSKIQACLTFGTLQSFCQITICEYHGIVTVHLK
jgi:hypothetical protein